MTESPTQKKRLIAVCGKGGTGKTASIAMMVRALVDDPALQLPGCEMIGVTRCCMEPDEVVPSHHHWMEALQTGRCLQGRWDQILAEPDNGD